MKNLINKITKLAMIPILAGSLTGCVNEKQLSPLEKHNQENAKVHEDFFNFYQNYPNKFKYGEVGKGHYRIELPNGENIDFTNDKFFLAILGDTSFVDWEPQGLSENYFRVSGSDYIVYKNEVTNIEELNEEKKLELSKNYMGKKKKIMHDAKYGGY